MNHVRREEKRQTSRASSSSSWWTCLWWHHRDRVWLNCLIAHEQHWCLEPDLYYAAEKQRRDKVFSHDDPRDVCICLQSGMQGEHFSQTIVIPMSKKNKKQNKRQWGIQDSWTSCKRTLKCEKWHVSWWISGRRKRTQQKNGPVLRLWSDGFFLVWFFKHCPGWHETAFKC